MAATSVTGIGGGYANKMNGYGAGAPIIGPKGVRASRIIYIEGDDGTIDINNIPDMTQNDIWQAAIIITDAGRVLKDRSGVMSGVVPSFDLVKDAPPKKVTKTKSKYRSIFDPTDIQADL